jgi:hypothetical protein
MEVVPPLSEREKKLVFLIEYAIDELIEWGSVEGVQDLQRSLCEEINLACDFSCYDEPCQSEQCLRNTWVKRDPFIYRQYFSG